MIHPGTAGLPVGVRLPRGVSKSVRRAAIGLSAGLLTALLATIGIVGAQESEAVLDLIKAVDTIWFIVAGVLVFFMQAGFGMLEAGFVRVKNTTNILMKNVLDRLRRRRRLVGRWLRIRIRRLQRLHRRVFLLPRPRRPRETDGVPESAVFFFQWAFAATPRRIVSGALAERTKFSAYLFYSVFITGLIYPIVVNWTWGGGWLGEMGFMDYAGSTVVHSVGAWAGLAGAFMLGPRIGKYASDGTVTAIPRPQHEHGRPRDVHPLVRLVRIQRRIDARPDRRPRR